MREKRIKLLFGTYTDEYNAQDINTLCLSKNMNHDIFEIHMFSQNTSYNGVICHKLSNNNFIKAIQKFIFIATNKFDLYYLPRLEKADLIFARLFHKNRVIISSVEIENAVHDENMKNFFCNYTKSFFAINDELKDNIKTKWGLDVPVLYLGFEKTDIKDRERKSLEIIAYAGGLVKRKRPDLFLDIAKKHPELQFVLIGGGALQGELEQKILRENIINAHITGRLSNKEVYEELNKCDLLVIVSDNEGQPKVALEAACVGVPTVYIKNNYRINFIQDGINGYAVNNINEVDYIIDELSNDGALLYRLSDNAKKLTSMYSWQELSKQYEEYFKEVLSKA